MLLLTGVIGGVLGTNLPWQVKSVALCAYALGMAAVGIHVGHMAWRNPRGLSYGPNEFIEESRLEHERRVREIQ
jgi:hypothetical protein